MRVLVHTDGDTYTSIALICAAFVWSFVRTLLQVCSQKLIRAKELISSLGGEKHRWTKYTEDLSEDYKRLTGDVLISAGVIAYLGPFTSRFRDMQTSQWVERCTVLKIPCSPIVSLNVTLGDPVLIREWNIQSLPTDSFSVDNGIIVFNARRWPLMIDPQVPRTHSLISWPQLLLDLHHVSQGQANKWVRNMEVDSNLRVIKLTDGDFLRTVENAVQFGQPVLLENIGGLPTKRTAAHSLTPKHAA